MTHGCQRPGGPWGPGGLVRWVTATLVAVSLTISSVARAQDDTTPAFSLASGQVYTTHERPSIDLTYRGVTQLDFRTYKVNDPFTFFAGKRTRTSSARKNRWCRRSGRCSSASRSSPRARASATSP